MARAPNEKAAEAEKMYRKGVKLAEIAQKLGVPPGTVRRWKSTYKWDRGQSERSDKQSECSDKQSERSDRKRTHRGGQSGNNNALKNAVYAEKYWEHISEDEKQMIEDMPSDEEFMLIESLKLAALRESRYMSLLARYKELLDKSDDGMIPKEDIRAVIKEMNSSDECKKRTVTAQQVKVDATQQMQIIEAELTRIQKIKIKIIESLANIRKGKGINNDNTPEVVIYGANELES